MGDNNILPKGGFLRGVLAGLTLIALIFIGLAVAFPLTVATGPVQSILEVEESSSDIPMNTDTPTLTALVDSPAPLDDAAPVVAVAPETTAPESINSQVETTPVNDIQIGNSESTPPVITAPVVSVIEMPVVANTPTIEDTAQAPIVSIEVSSGSGENDTSTEPQAVEEVVESALETSAIIAGANEPSTGVELEGQTLISSDEPTQVETVEPSAPDTAFSAFSAEFSDDSDLPLMSFILLVNTVAEAEVLSNFSTLITLAVASDNPAPNEIIASYRTSGGEAVLMLPVEGANALRKGGNTSDVPAFLDASLANIEGVLGVMDGPDGDVNQDTRMISAMLTTLSETGHAIMTVNGLGRNRTSILARETGVPATDISRVIDTADGTIAVIRVLDKLVLQIGDQRSVTVFAEATPDMLVALKFWFESQKAQSVSIAPVSASILRN